MHPLIIASFGFLGPIIIAVLIGATWGRRPPDSPRAFLHEITWDWHGL